MCFLNSYASTAIVKCLWSASIKSGLDVGFVRCAQMHSDKPTINLQLTALNSIGTWAVLCCSLRKLQEVWKLLLPFTDTGTQIKNLHYNLLSEQVIPLCNTALQAPTATLDSWQNEIPLEKHLHWCWKSLGTGDRAGTRLNPTSPNHWKAQGDIRMLRMK